MPLNQLEQSICAAVAGRRDSLLRDLREHVAIPTGQGFRSGVERYQQVMIERLQGLAGGGAKIECVKGEERPAWLTLPGGKGTAGEGFVPDVIVARRKEGVGGPRILLAGHLDTVHDPHGNFQELNLSDGKTATGPGAADMKGGLVIALHALEVLRELDVDINWTFLLNADEETGSFHSFEALRAAALEHDVGLALEPALPDGSLVTQRGGAGQFKIEVFGKSAHVGREFARGVSAVNKLAEIITQLATLSAPEKGLIVNVGPLQGGHVTNAVPEYAACWGNVRFVDESGATHLRHALDRLATKDEELPGVPRVRVHHAINRPAKPLIPAVQKLAELVRETASDVGQRLEFNSTGGVCDGNILQDAGLPTIDTLGVRGGNLHRTDEFIEVASLVERCQLLAMLMLRLSRQKTVHRA